MKSFSVLALGSAFLLATSVKAETTIGNMTVEELVKALDGADTPLYVASALDQFWLIFGACLVFLMQAGFALLEVGSVSRKNTKNILIKNVFDASMGALAYYFLGYGFALGAGSGFIGGTDFLLTGENFFPADGKPFAYSGYSYATFFFQFAFAATAATIVSGAVAERVKFSAYLVYSFALTAFIYPVVVHWGWSGDGWASAWMDNQEDKLFNAGVIDFAGSGVVHMVGGMAALVGAYFIGARNGRFNADGSVNDLPQQSAVYQTVGTLILFFGWFGFNACSTLALGAGLADVASKTAVTTVLAAAAGCMSTLFTGKVILGHTDIGMANNGILAGLVSITAGCSTVEPYAAVIIGFLGGLVYIGSSKLLLKLLIDDVVGAAPVHLFCGAWGVIAAGLFATPWNYKMAYYDYGDSTPCGLFYGCGANQFAANIVFVLAVIAWTGALAGLLFFGITKTIGLRIPPEEEEIGLDESHHGGADNPELGAMLAKNKELELANAAETTSAAV